MKHGKLRKLLALVLVLCMSVSLVVPAYAAGGSSSAHSAFGRSLIQSWNSFWDKLFGGSDDAGDADLTLVEDETTVEPGAALRASTYALDAPSAQADTTILKYFPVTLYDYDDRINNATHQAEVDAALNNGGIGRLTTWNGIYFGGNGRGASVENGESYTYSNDATGILQYANWNKWVGNFTSNTSKSGNRIYSGLVQPNLTTSKDIQFTKTEGGIFDTNGNVKDIYNNVGLPFQYDSTTKYYTFDANEFGAYFSGKASSNTNLDYSETPQSQEFCGQDQRTRGWYPFNNTTNVRTTSADYFFGMKATIPFTMTANGRMNANDSASAPIVFNFAGDDDVWVFVDGVLVLDIGGVRNMLEGSIDFANNTWTISKPTNQNGGDLGDAATSQVALSGKIFNEENDNTTGTLNQTRETFAAKDSHELTIFYLERGAGSSNCKIQFNLPMKDTVSVTKQINQAKTQNADGTVTISPLSASEQAVIDEMDFGFTLYKDNAPVANMNYSLLNVNGQVIGTPSTDANGHFDLKNGQTAKFVGAINSTEGNKYYVVEDEKVGFWAPDYTYTADVANGATQAVAANGWTGMTVQAIGSDEAEDHITFVCKNYMNNELPNPGALLNDDKIVIDYGLPVEIDAFKNDLYRGDSMKMTDVTGAKYGEVNFDKETGKITYQLTEQLTGVEVLTYTVLVTGTAENAGGTENQATLEAKGRVYIIPATSMYYEENFSDLVTFTGEWEAEGTAQTDPQEPGVVGTVGDSPYGSDAAYLNDSGDSNGSSMYVDTTKGAASFSYTFTGTGTSFFARTTNNSGYMRVVITEDGEEVYQLRRDTSFKTEDNKKTLYNIPVFTWEAENYGTYEVTVTIATQNKLFNFGNEFWLDGIRVVKPLDSTDQNASVAASAYAADGEANMTVATLRQKIIQESMYEDENGYLVWDGENFVIFTDTNGEIQLADEYRSNGPKEEVYLNKGQSVSFSLYNWDANSNKIYLGIKAPTGSGTVSINGNTLNINNAADCYYDISNFASITEGEDGVNTATFKITATSSLISVTNIKVTGKAEFTIVNQEDPTVDGGEGEQQ